MTDTVVVEGQVRLREGKKWKNRWVVLRKPSPVADCLCVLVYKERSERSKGHRERMQLTLGDICGLELLQGYEGMNYSLTLLCLTQSLTLAFDSKENLLAWDTRIRYSLGEVHRFNVSVQPGTVLESGPASLHLCNNMLALARDLPPAVMGHWRLADLRRYGAVPHGFIFEGGTRCGYWTGVFFLACAEGEQISFLFDCIARGISPNRTVFGLRPSLPDLSVQSSSLVEERITQEASELEKRLSMLSVCSQQSITVSHSSSTTSLAGDARSISSSSSDTSHSDVSLSSRLATWYDPPRFPATLEQLVSPSGALASRHRDEHLGRGLRPPSKPPHPRGLQETGRQNSTDSGIATGSHSSYSGSFSSYTGSLDTTQGEVEDFGSVMSLTLNSNPGPTTLLAHDNTSLRITPQPQSAPPGSTSMAPGSKPCMCSINVAPEGQDLEYQVPAQLLQHYDFPRKLVQFPSSIGAEGGVLGTSGSPAGIKTTLPVRFSSNSDGVNLHPGFITPQHNLCPVCGGMRVTPSTTTRHPPAPVGVGMDLFSASVHRDKPKLKMNNTTGPPSVETTNLGVNTETELISRFELMSRPSQQRGFWETEGCSLQTPTSPRCSLRLFRHSSSSGRSLGDSVGTGGVKRVQLDSNYINIPINPVSKHHLNYMELDLQDVSDANHIRGSISTKYAHIDIAATETAQRVGAQHAQGREDGLHQLEQKRRGTLN